jgi:hypothetical protein
VAVVDRWFLFRGTYVENKHGKRDPKTVIDVDRWSIAQTLQKII